MRTHLCPLPVLQKGAYWRRTWSVLFDDPNDEDSDTRNPRCARLSCNRVCVCVGVCVSVRLLPHKGAYWRWTCFVLFNCQLTRILTFRPGVLLLVCLSHNRACVCVCVYPPGHRGNSSRNGCPRLCAPAPMKCGVCPIVWSRIGEIQGNGDGRALTMPGDAVSALIRCRTKRRPAGA